MEGLKKIGMFFVYWIAVIVGCFLTLFVTRFLIHEFDIAKAVGMPIDGAGNAALVFVLIGLLVAWRCTKRYKKKV